MKLLLDLGNSRCKAAFANGDTITHQALLCDKESRLATVEMLLREKKILKQVVICSVWSEELNHELKKLLHRQAIHDYYFIEPQTDSFGVQLGYANPGQMGPDRLAVMIAANEKFKGNKCIVDCGTAVTIDVLDADGIHHGGIIFPGTTSMQRAMYVETGVAYRKGDGRIEVLADNTSDAIYAGCLTAVAGGIRQAVNIMQEQRGLFDLIAITGGDAELVLPMFTEKVLHQPEMVLDGLMIISEKL